MNYKKVIKSILISLLILVVLCLCATLIFVYSSINSVKNLDINLTTESSQQTCFFDNNNNIINTNKDTTYITYNKIPTHTINAFTSIEDKEFFNHNGLNYKRIIKATINNLKKLNYSEGASTITQQLIKNKYLSNEKTLSRKVKEAYLALKLEQIEPKEKILESYLNTIYYGHGIYGIENASRYYFNKTTQDLTLNESCVLAGLINSPGKYSPINNLDKCIERRNLILKEMYEDDFIDKSTYNNTQKENLVLDITEPYHNNKSLYLQYALDEASQILNIDKNKLKQLGYKIYTYQDNTIQKHLDSSINNPNNYQKNNHGNIADSLGIVINNRTHGVSAISGKSKYDLINFKRQPGSLIKPILVYTPAFEEKIIYPSSKILDEKISINGYSPKNVGNKFYNYVSIKDAFAKSLNIPAIKLCNEIGINKCKNYASKCGILFSDNDNGLAISLGGLYLGCTLKEITDAYSVYTNDGNYYKSSFIKEIRNVNNVSLYNNILSKTHVFSNDSAYLTTTCLQHSVNTGTSKKLSNSNYDIAGKTGTVNIKNSNNNTDAYSLAFTSEHTINVWLGNYSMDEKYHLNGNNNGGTYATEIVKQTLSSIYKNHLPADFNIPETITILPIDNISYTNNNEVFIADNMPEKYIQYEYFSINNLPPKNNLLNNSIFNDSSLSAKQDNNSISITFLTHDYYIYELYRKNNNSNQLLKTFNNTNGHVEYIDLDIIRNNQYHYYLKIISPYSNSIITTNYVTINYNEKFTTPNDNLSWIFV